MPEFSRKWSVLQRKQEKLMGEDAKMVETSLKKAHFVLIHGISGGAWCWYKVRCLLENSGYKVSCLDLKSAGTDPTDANSVHTFDDYNKPLLDFMSSLPDHEEVILIGHSAGGLSVTQASHRFAKKIKLSVYVAATMLRLGCNSEQDIKDGVPDLSEYGDVYKLGYGLGPDQPTSAIIKKEFQRRLLYNASPQEDSTLASMLLKPGPFLALTNARFTEGNEVDNVPRIYIKTIQDRIMKIDQQHAMIERWPPSQVYVLDSDHSPFFSSPFLLSGLLVTAAASFGCN